MLANNYKTIYRFQHGKNNLFDAQNPTAIQLHLKKLFAAIHTAGFSADDTNIIELFSAEKERVTLTQKV